MENTTNYGEVIEKDFTEEELAERKQWEAEEYNRLCAEVELTRKAVYAAEADPLNMEWQATGEESTRQAWLAKREEIKERYPYPVKE